MGGKVSASEPMEVNVPEIKALLKRDPWLEPYEKEIRKRYAVFQDYLSRIQESDDSIIKFSEGYKYFGMIFNEDNSVTCREWAPGASQLYLTGDFNGWNRTSHPYTKLPFGKWALQLPPDKDGSCAISHLSETNIIVQTDRDDHLERLSPWASYVVQPPEGEGLTFKQKAWKPSTKYVFKYAKIKKPESLRIYECHIGIAGTEAKVNTCKNFTDNVIPRIAKLGYNAIQIMAVMEHAYYASFGYQVTNFFAVSSRFGTPDDFKELVDAAHASGLYVMLDIVNTHASRNTLDGLNEFDGTDSCYFHSGARGVHQLWDCRMFNFSEYEVVRFLLSTLRWYMDEYNFDGFRFDAITAVMFHNRGLGEGFAGTYNEYFGLNIDTDALVYLMLANYMLHSIYPDVITIAEDVSGMPGLCRPIEEGGIGFDYRLGMAIPDMWIKLMKNVRDEDWNMGHIVYTLTNRRQMEKTIAYVECHDQALVGDKSLAFWLMDKEMYTHMSILSEPNVVIERGIALHKMIRLLTHALGGNEFGHPEWLDFPRAGNNNSYNYARRQWNLVDDDLLKYKLLNNFDIALNHLEEKYGWLRKGDPGYVSLKHESDKIIVFERAGLLFLFNFHPYKSFPDYRVGIETSGNYKVLLNSDDTHFGGFNRIDASVRHNTFPQEYHGRKNSLLVYLPCRTCLILG